MKKNDLSMYHSVAKIAIGILEDIYVEMGEPTENLKGSKFDTGVNGVRINYYTLDRVTNLFKSIDKEIKNIDFTQFTQEELSQFGFSQWDDEGLMLAPKWVFRIMSPGTILTSISGQTKIFGSDDIDLDTRFGATAWGITKSQLRDAKIINVLDESTEIY